MGREEGSAIDIWSIETSDAKTLSEAQARPGPHSNELSSPKMLTVPRLRNPDLRDLLNEESHSEERSLPAWARGGAFWSLWWG